jgi:hypothetical protein
VNVEQPEIKVPDVTVNIPKKKPITLAINRNIDGQITGIQEK